MKCLENHQWILKPLGENLMKDRIVPISSSYFPTNYLLVAREKNSDLMEMKTGSYHLNQIIKVNIASIGTN